MYDDIEYIPVPYIKTDRNGKIIGFSRAAMHMFPLKERSLYQIVDEFSVEKLTRALMKMDENYIMELNLNTKTSPTSLFEVHITRDPKGYYHFILNEKDTQIQLLANKLQDLQERLASTNLELFEKTMELESANYHLNELSGPFIPLTQNIGLVPLFGDITKEKVEIIGSNIESIIYEGEYDSILFDLTATGKFEKESIDALSSLFKKLQIIASPDITIIGTKPKHALAIKEFILDWNIHYIGSLQQALAKKQAT
ncbi:Stressosome protein rsbRB [Peribacillus sp. SCS-155]|uniref:Stressosome protein rsbRB n=1 Tax=Peribacillus sedimenti TaxID=3115297 RepID=UPI00390646FF